MLEFATPAGKEYKVDPITGRINNYRDWYMLGIRHTKRTSHFIPLADITPELLATLEMRYKTSGNPQWTIEDLDRGYRRTWMNTKYRGIRWMCFVEDGDA